MSRQGLTAAFALAVSLLLPGAPAALAQESVTNVLLSFQESEKLRDCLARSIWELKVREDAARTEYQTSLQPTREGQGVIIAHPSLGKVLMVSADLLRGGQILEINGPNQAACRHVQVYWEKDLNLAFLPCLEGDRPLMTVPLADPGAAVEAYFSLDNPRSAQPSIFHSQAAGPCEAPLADYLCLPLGGQWSAALFDFRCRFVGLTLRRLGPFPSRLSIAVSAAQIWQLTHPQRRGIEDMVKPHPGLKRPFEF